ncbi:MAG: Crp/Fnr family transcriptional regulator [Marinifilaceae bacterium]
MPDCDIFKRHGELERLKQLIMERGERVRLRRGECFVREGEMCDKVAYVVSGGFKMYASDGDGREHIVSFAFEREVVACYLPARVGEPALLSVQAVEPSVVVWVSMQSVLSVFEAKVNGELYVRSFVDALAYELLRRHVAFRRNSAQERYLELIARVPDVLNRVSLKEVALYLDIAPETLSRMRKRMLLADREQNS